MNVKIVDTTLRDGEQQAGIALGAGDKVKIARLLDSAKIYQIEAGIPAMGGEEKKSVEKMMALNLRSKISTWNRMNLKDIEQSIQCKPDIIHISVPASDIQIRCKLKKNRTWVIETMKRCINYARESGAEVTVGLEDASRADLKFVLQLISAAFLEGVERIRYADTVGILHRKRTFAEISSIKARTDIALEIHAHNDLGMAVSNSISAVKAGAEFVDCTMGGIGERAGNCDYLQFVKAAGEFLHIFDNVKEEEALEIQKEIFHIMGLH
ncbi:MAG: homocitrate synthase [Clostridiales bacterium]|nr:homocitrate synthase [Eubacteriales bacterium]MDH7567193.1 homocitrate synthase [Clostridiales bacterium]